MISSMPRKITLRQLFSGVSEKELDEITDVLHGYLAVAWRVYERLEREHPEVIDALMENRRMKGKVDSSREIN
jgi:hypothetical protein